MLKFVAKNYEGKPFERPWRSTRVFETCCRCLDSSLGLQLACDCTEIYITANQFGFLNSLFARSYCYSYCYDFVFFVTVALYFTLSSITLLFELSCLSFVETLSRRPSTEYRQLYQASSPKHDETPVHNSILDVLLLFTASCNKLSSYSCATPLK